MRRCHGGLPSPRRSAPRIGSSASRSRLSISTLTRGRRRCRTAGPRCGAPPDRRIRDASTPRASATRRTCSAALAGEMCGSRPEPERVTMSDGSGPCTPSSFRTSATEPAMSVSASLRSVGPLLAAGRRRGVVAGARGGGAGMEVFRPDESPGRSARCRPGGRSSSTTEPFAWRGKSSCARAGDHRGVDDARDQTEHDRQHDRGAELIADHGITPVGVRRGPCRSP